MDYTSNFSASGVVEYTLKRRLDAPLIMRMSLISIICWGIFFLSLFVLRNPVWLIPVFAIVCWGWVFFWRYCSIEYDFLFAEGEVEISSVFGKKTRKRLLCKSISAIRSVEKYTPETMRDKKGKKFYAASSLASPDIYVIVFNEKNGTNSILTTELTPDALKYLKRSAPSAFRV